eukprot:4592879-Amphidinium_carterae.1
MSVTGKGEEFRRVSREFAMRCASCHCAPSYRYEETTLSDLSRVSRVLFMGRGGWTLLEMPMVPYRPRQTVVEKNLRGTAMGYPATHEVRSLLGRRVEKQRKMKPLSLCRCSGWSWPS